MDRPVMSLPRLNTVQFIRYNPNRKDIVASGLSNGLVDLWDLRKPNSPFHSFQAHLNNVNCLDWHPSDENLIISSGQNDRFIKVWNVRDDLLTGQMHPLFSIYTPSSVKKCQWIPGHTSLITSHSS